MTPMCLKTGFHVPEDGLLLSVAAWALRACSCGSAVSAPTAATATSQGPACLSFSASHARRATAARPAARTPPPSWGRRRPARRADDSAMPTLAPTRRPAARRACCS
eukprot:scaffold61697_cov52-Phaeocystis_antarctica.AAC.2